MRSIARQSEIEMTPPDEPGEPLTFGLTDATSNAGLLCAWAMAFEIRPPSSIRPNAAGERLSDAVAHRIKVTWCFLIAGVSHLNVTGL